MQGEEAAMKTDILLRHWWLPALRGAIAVAFGLTTLMWPGITLLRLAALFAAFALVGGAVWTFAALENLVNGVMDVIVAVRLRKYVHKE